MKIIKICIVQYLFDTTYIKNTLNIKPLRLLISLRQTDKNLLFEGKQEAKCDY